MTINSHVTGERKAGTESPGRRALIPASRHARPLFGVAILALATFVFGSASVSAANDRSAGAVRVMTQNMDEGTDFLELLNAHSDGEFVAAVTLTFQNIQATKPAERAAAIPLIPSFNRGE